MNRSTVLGQAAKHICNTAFVLRDFVSCLCECWVRAAIARSTCYVNWLRQLIAKRLSAAYPVGLFLLEDLEMLKQLWRDDSGAIVSLEIVLIGTILGVGVITGLSSLRDAVITTFCMGAPPTALPLPARSIKTNVTTAMTAKPQLPSAAWSSVVVPSLVMPARMRAVAAPPSPFGV